jgi:hypothetical protein
MAICWMLSSQSATRGMGMAEHLVSNGVRFWLQGKSGWMRIHTCTNCHARTDEDDHKSICPECGDMNFESGIGRWLAYYPRTTFMRSLLMFIGALDYPLVHFVVEFKEARNG